MPGRMERKAAGSKREAATSGMILPNDRGRDQRRPGDDCSGRRSVLQAETLSPAEDLMQKLLLVIIGLALLGFGGYRQFADAGVSAADQARCEELVRAQSGSDAEALALLLPKCSDPGMVAMMDAQASGDDAQAAARRISEANQGDLSAHLLDFLMIGAGLVALAAAAVLNRRRA